jgi:hypothetical protein
MQPSEKRKPFFDGFLLMEKSNACRSQAVRRSRFSGSANIIMLLQQRVLSFKNIACARRKGKVEVARSG